MKKYHRDTIDVQIDSLKYEEWTMYYMSRYKKRIEMIRKNEERSMIPRIVGKIDRSRELMPFRSTDVKIEHTDQTKEGWWVRPSERNKIPSDGERTEGLIRDGRYERWSNDRVPLGAVDGETPVSGSVGRVRPEERINGGRGYTYTDLCEAERVKRDLDDLLKSLDL